MIHSLGRLVALNQDRPRHLVGGGTMRFTWWELVGHGNHVA